MYIYLHIYMCVCASMCENPPDIVVSQHFLWHGCGVINKSSRASVCWPWSCRKFRSWEGFSSGGSSQKCMLLLCMFVCVSAQCVTTCKCKCVCELINTRCVQLKVLASVWEGPSVVFSSAVDVENAAAPPSNTLNPNICGWSTHRFKTSGQVKARRKKEGSRGGCTSYSLCGVVCL